jgi:inosose dehydratase
VRVANAPVSYGVFEITIGTPGLPGPEELIASMAEAGYDGTELGPPGFLGTGNELRERLERHGLALVGGWIQLRLSDPEYWHADLATMAETLDLFAAAGANGVRPVLADGGSPARMRNPGCAIRDRSLGLDDCGWRRFAGGLARAVELSRNRGFEPVFHHHAGTYVEAPWEIERMLELSDVPLLLDTGHLTIGGGDAVEALRDWRSRVGHLHVKDVRADVLESVVADGADMVEAWRRGVFCELGTGDVDLEAFFAELATAPYKGWVVIEQDRILEPGEGLAEAGAAQARNRRWLAERAGL